MVKRLKDEGYWVRGVDIKHPEFSRHQADEFVIGDLRDKSFVNRVVEWKGYQGNFFNSIPYKMIESFDEIYQFAADMGGAGYIFTGENDADIMHNSATINLNLLDAIVKASKRENRSTPKVFYSSSACAYPSHIQEDVDNPGLKEDDAYPANPDSDYGWEKLFSERLYLAYSRNHGIPVRVARYHNIYGPEGTWDGGKEKAPAAMCRKVASVASGETVDCWGDGEQTRSFLYIDDCLEATRRLMDSSCEEVINIGSEEMVTINELIHTAAKVADKEIKINHIDGPLGVRGRNSQNDMIREKLNWDYQYSLEQGMSLTYNWISDQVYQSQLDEKQILHEQVLEVV